mmetsp:Transcript_1884/g.6202  ORF Transcript_1884/g.6202 Transcript_1884/m.6202 type:complete len:441 (-) Transcript_1884:2077-3399(-)
MRRAVGRGDGQPLLRLLFWRQPGHGGAGPRLDTELSLDGLDALVVGGHAGDDLLLELAQVEKAVVVRHLNGVHALVHQHQLPTLLLRVDPQRLRHHVVRVRLERKRTKRRVGHLDGCNVRRVGEAVGRLAGAEGRPYLGTLRAARHPLFGLGDLHAVLLGFILAALAGAALHALATACRVAANRASAGCTAAGVERPRRTVLRRTAARRRLRIDDRVHGLDGLHLPVGQLWRPDRPDRLPARQAAQRHVLHLERLDEARLELGHRHGPSLGRPRHLLARRRQPALGLLCHALPQPRVDEKHLTCQPVPGLRRLVAGQQSVEPAAQVNDALPHRHLGSVGRRGPRIRLGLLLFFLKGVGRRLDVRDRVVRAHRQPRGAGRRRVRLPFLHAQHKKGAVGRGRQQVCFVKRQAGDGAARLVQPERLVQVALPERAAHLRAQRD